jgi:hypothetical protein
MNLITVHENPQVISAKAEINKLANWLSENKKGLSVDWNVSPLLETAIAGNDIENLAINLILNYFPYWKTRNYQLIQVELPNLAKVRQINEVIESGEYEPRRIIQKIITSYQVGSPEQHRV